MMRRLVATIADGGVECERNAVWPVGSENMTPTQHWQRRTQNGGLDAEKNGDMDEFLRTLQHAPRCSKTKQ